MMKPVMLRKGTERGASANNLRPKQAWLLEGIYETNVN